MNSGSEHKGKGEPVAHCTVRPLHMDESFARYVVSWVGGQPIAGPLYSAPTIPEGWLKDVLTYLDGMAEFDQTYPAGTVPRNRAAELLLAAAPKGETNEQG